MSFVSKNKKFLNLDNLRVFYDRKENVIKLTSTDEDLAGKPFQITLKQGTESEATLRDLLIENEVITEEEVDPQYGIPKYVKYPERKEDCSKWHEIPIGAGKNGETITVDLMKAPHALVVGYTGSGKSVFLRNYILHSLRHQNNWAVFGIDLKRVEFSPYKNVPSIKAIASDFDDAVVMLEYLNDIMAKRYQQMEEENVSNFFLLKELPKAAMLMIEEATVLFTQEGYKTEEGRNRDKQAARALEIVGNLVRLGRAAGIFVTIATQRPSVEVIPGEMRANLDTRVAMSRLDSTPSALTLGNDNASKIPSNLKGRGIVRSHGLYDESGNKVSETEIFFQTFYSSPNLQDEIIEFKDDLSN